MPSYNKNHFQLEYAGLEMNKAFIDRKDLGRLLYNIISTKDVKRMNSVSDRTFNIIRELDVEENMYELSIALTNYYFETIWRNCENDISEGKMKIAQDKITWACEIVWKQEQLNSYTFHKGTPYYFLGFCHLINGNLDLAFQMIHNGHMENLTAYPRLHLDYKTAPSYLFMTLNTTDSRNYMHDYDLLMKGKLEYFIEQHNWESKENFTYDVFDKKFLQHTNKKFDNVKFYLVYFVMNLINMNLPQERFLTNNDFSNIRKIELMFDLGIIIDKTLSESYGTDYIREGVIKFLNQVVGISETNYDQLRNHLSYEDGSPFYINADPKVVAKGILNHDVLYDGKPIGYNFRCMLLAWNLRNFSAHNLSGIDDVLKNSFSSMLTMLFSAFFFSIMIL